jgi:hypothetical protein
MLCSNSATRLFFQFARSLADENEFVCIEGFKDAESYGAQFVHRATIINIAVLHSTAAAMTIPLCAAFALIARARWEHTTKLLAARTGR